MSIDHIIPKTEGGNGNVENLRIAHRKCNSDRGKSSQWRFCKDCPHMNKEN